MVWFAGKNLNYEGSLDELLVQQDKLINDLNIDLNFDVLTHVSNLAESWQEIMNLPPSNKYDLFYIFYEKFKIITDSNKQKEWWMKYQEFDDAFNRVNNVIGIEISAKVVIEENIKPHLIKNRNENYFKTLVFLAKFYKIIKFNFNQVFIGE